MGCMYSRIKLTLHIITETKYKTFPIEQTYDIQMNELHIFIEDENILPSGKLSFMA